MRDGMRRFLSTVIAVGGGVALAMLTVDTAWQYKERHQCGFKFDYSGRCVRWEGHKGEHY